MRVRAEGQEKALRKQKIQGQRAAQENASEKKCCVKKVEKKNNFKELVRSKRKQNVKKNMGGKIDQVTTRPRRSVLPFILITTRIPVYSRGSSLYDFVINTKSDHKQSRNFLLIQSRPTQSNECVCWDLSARSHDQTSTYNLHKS